MPPWFKVCKSKAEQHHHLITIMKKFFLLINASVIFISLAIGQKKYEYDFQNPSLPIENV
jgi:uncharacterized membrane protein